jgi:exonuclease SbcD
MHFGGMLRFQAGVSAGPPRLRPAFVRDPRKYVALVIRHSGFVILLRHLLTFRSLSHCLMKFLHAADIHLDSPLCGLDRYECSPVEKIRGATRRALDNLVQHAIQERVDFLLIAGDLYDGDWPDYNTGLFFSRQMGRLREAGIPVFLIRGNHDAESRLTRELRLPENVRVFPTQEASTHLLEDLGVAIHGRSFATAAVTENLAASFPQALPGFLNIGLLHTSATGFAGHENYAPCSIADLEAKRYDYWALGHVHVRTELKRDEPWIVFPGNLQGRHARETGPKGASLVTVEDGRITRIEHCPLDVVRWTQLEIDVTGSESVEEVLALTQRAFEQETDRAGDRLVAARAFLRGASQAHAAIAAKPEQFLNQLRAVANDLGGIWLEKARIETSPAPPIRPIRSTTSPEPPSGPSAEAEDAPAPHLAGLQFHWDNPEELTRFAAELEPLKKKLPPELLAELGLEDPTRLRELLADAEKLLLPRLLATGAPQ